MYDTLDIGLLVSHLRETHHGPLFVVGFSMGAAKLTNFLGRTKTKSNVDGACCICCPWDFTENNSAVHKPNFVERCYHFIITNAVKLWVALHYSALSKNKRLKKKSPAFRRTRSGLLWWMGTHDMVSFDNTFTINWLGYDNVHEYYEAASPHNQLPNVTTPLLIINSRNDPLIPNVVNPGPEIMKDLPNAVAIECEYGGHIGFWTPFRGDWTAQCVISFIQQPHLNQRNLSKARSKTGIRRKNSQQIAQMLRVTSKTGLNDYKGIERM
ncbi:hypothetical protein TeGR_g4297, partial [Tetraparma gracilis]